MKLNPRNIILILSILLFLIFLLYICYPPVTNTINKTLDPNFPLNKTMTGTIWGLLVVILIGALISISLTNFRKEKDSNLDELVKERLIKELNDKDATLKEHKLTIEQKERQFIELFKKYKELDKNISLDKNDIKIKEALNSANFEKAEELLLLDLKNQDIKKSKTYINLGDISYIKQDFTQAILYYEKALQLDKTNQDSKFNIAICYGQIGDYKKNIDILLQIKKGNLYAKEKEYLFLASLANAYLPLGYSKETIKYGLKALESYNKLGIEDNYFRMILNLDLSNAYYQVGDYPTSLKYDKKALEIHNEYYNNDDSILANIYSRRGSTYNQLGQYEESLKYNKKVLDIRKNKYGENSQAVAASCSNIGSTYSNLGDNEKAIEYTQKALNIVNTFVKYAKFDIAQYNSNIGYYYLKLGNAKEAIVYLGKALKLRKELFEEDNIYIASTYMNLGDAYSLNGDYDKALIYLKKSLEIRKRILPQDHSDIASSYSNLGGAYARKGFLDDAIESNKKAYEIYKNKLGEKHPDTLITYFNIGSVLFLKGEYKESITYIEIAERGLLKSLNSNHPYLINCYEMFASLYMEVMDTYKAKEYLEKLQSMNKLEKKELLGLVYASIGMETNSREYLEKAFKLIPNIPLYEEILKDIEELNETL